jgi:5-methylcytosine-specific restriction endonuclease McrA
MNREEQFKKTKELYEQGISIYQIEKILGVKNGTARYWIKHDNIKFMDKQPLKIIETNSDAFKTIVKESFSIAEILKKANVKICASNYRKVHKKIKELKLNTSHFTGQGWNIGKTHADISEKNLLEYLNNNKKVQSNRLKKALIKFNYKKNECEKCHRTEWEGYPIPLELHHKDGNHFNNKLENLEILCPNCHSLQPTYKDTSKYGAKKNTIEDYKNAIESSFNIREACIKLKISPKGGNYYVIKNKIEKYGFKLKQDNA